MRGPALLSTSVLSAMRARGPHGRPRASAGGGMGMGAGMGLRRGMSARPIERERKDSGEGKAPSPPKKRTIASLHALHRSRTPITCLTAYDYPTSNLIESTHHSPPTPGIDITLVGDSLALTCLGHASTTSLTLDEMIHHCRAVMRGAKTPFVVADLPFGTYHCGADEAVRSAVRLVREGGVDGVKLEGGCEIAETVRRIVEAGVPVMGHVGLLPQRATLLSGFKVQGRSPAAALAILHDALAIQHAGAFAVVLEAIPTPLGAYITERLDVPSIGIGAGPGTAGQVLVQADLLGLYDAFKPKFVRRYAEWAKEGREAMGSWARDVREGAFPAEKEAYGMDKEAWEEFMALAEQESVDLAGRST